MRAIRAVWGSPPVAAKGQARKHGRAWRCATILTGGRGRCKKKGPAVFSGKPRDVRGGGDGDRTHDLGVANAALSQLSYAPGGGKAM